MNQCWASSHTTLHTPVLSVTPLRHITGSLSQKFDSPDLIYTTNTHSLSISSNEELNSLFKSNTRKANNSTKPTWKFQIRHLTTTTLIWSSTITTIPSPM